MPHHSSGTLHNASHAAFLSISPPPFSTLFTFSQAEPKTVLFKQVVGPLAPNRIPGWPSAGLVVQVSPDMKVSDLCLAISYTLNQRLPAGIRISQQLIERLDFSDCGPRSFSGGSRLANTPRQECRLNLLIRNVLGDNRIRVFDVDDHYFISDVLVLCRDHFGADIACMTLLHGGRTMLSHQRLLDYNLCGIDPMLYLLIHDSPLKGRSLVIPNDIYLELGLTLGSQGLLRLGDPALTLYVHSPSRALAPPPADDGGDDDDSSDAADDPPAAPEDPPKPPSPRYSPSETSDDEAEPVDDEVNGDPGGDSPGYSPEETSDEEDEPVDDEAAPVLGFFPLAVPSTIHGPPAPRFEGELGETRRLLGLEMLDFARARHDGEPAPLAVLYRRTLAAVVAARESAERHALAQSQAREQARALLEQAQAQARAAEQQARAQAQALADQAKEVADALVKAEKLAKELALAQVLGNPRNTQTETIIPLTGITRDGMEVLQQIRQHGKRTREEAGLATGEEQRTTDPVMDLLGP